MMLLTVDNLQFDFEVINLPFTVEKEENILIVQPLYYHVRCCWHSKVGKNTTELYENGLRCPTECATSLSKVFQSSWIKFCIFPIADIFRLDGQKIDLILYEKKFLLPYEKCIIFICFLIYLSIFIRSLICNSIIDLYNLNILRRNVKQELSRNGNS